ncbi:MAG: serine/threonine-protein kinase, partial [Gammaproteobacteria bacterium]|nr:serine/threonine-protein kinase [Gammaproteobacteria bacterium]
MSEEKLRNALRPGHKLHWYQIEKVLGQGGFGITYLAYDANLDQHVAIKEYLPMELAVREGDFSVYPASEAQDERYKWGLDRFLTEARTLARFRHSAIVRVMSVFEENNTAYMVMEYQQGQSLQQLLERERTLTESELIGLVKPMLDGLETIHSQGFIHRDIKPSNIYIHDDGQPVLLDFGSARQALGEHTQTLTSVVSPGYAPFEQYYSRSDRQGPWTDIYGLGATLYRCITGLQPMAAIDRSEAILKAERDVFVAASEIGAGKYSDAFLAAVDHALQFNEKKRPQTIAEWRQQFDFSTSGEVEPRDSLNTTYPDHATTRFSEVLDDTFDITTGALFDSEVRDTAPQSRPSTRSKPHSRPSTRSKPHSAPSGASLPSDTTPRSARRKRREGSASAPPTATMLDAAKRRLWPITLLILVVTAAAAAWYFRDAGFIPQLVLTSKSGQEARRLIEQGNRALAAGQVFEPFDNSALAFYVAAYAA